ncbi:MAG TPA: ankyrin repeat domain-containing protein [Azospirillum sp.]|nr:ankyrin repeat domain-containing protein [Azospirillum sp.]
MDRHAQHPASPTPGRSAQRFHPDQQEAYDGLLLALLARKRFLVLAGGAGAQRSDVFTRLIEQVAADGSLVLPVVAQHGMQVEDLLVASASATLPDADDADFDTLVGELDDRLDLAGSGLLAVADAHLLSPATLIDLAELSRSETSSGRFVQILLSGSSELERALARPGLEQFIRDMGVIYRLAGGGAGLSPQAEASPHPAAADLSMRPIASSVPDLPAPDGPDPDWTVPPEMIIPPVRTGRRAAAGVWVTALILIATGGAATTLAVQALKPDLELGSLDEYATRVGAGAVRIWADAESAAREWSRVTFGWPPREGEALALHRSRAPDMEMPPPTLPPPETPPAALPKEARAALPPTINERPAAPPPPPPPDHAPAAKAEAGPLPPTFMPSPIILPPLPPTPRPPAPVTVASVPPPPVETPPAPPASTPPPAPPPGPMTVTSEPPPAPPVEAPPPAAPAPSVQVAALPPKPPTPPQPDQATVQRVRVLSEQARRQIATKRLTTPTGDNAYETVQRIRELTPDSPEIPELLSGIVDTYRRWAAQAEADGDPTEAKRYYERALMVSPDDPALRAQIRSTEERARRAEPPPPVRQPPTDVASGFTDQETTLAILHHTPSLAAVLGAGQNPNQRLENGKTPLMLAAEAGLREATRQLLDRGASPNLRTRDGATAIMYAAWNGREDVVSLLADAGADVNTGNDDGKTALMAAAARGHAGVVRVLLARGATVDRAANHGWTALMYAAHAGNEPVVRMLMESGANPTRTDQMGNSAVSLSRQQGHVISALMGR